MERRRLITVYLLLGLMNWIAPRVINAQQTIQLIRDPHFERGFWCLEPKHPLEGGRIFREGKLQLTMGHGEPVWELVQWYSKGSIAKLEPIASPAGGKIWQSDLKRVVLNPRNQGEARAGSTEVVTAYIMRGTLSG